MGADRLANEIPRGGVEVTFHWNEVALGYLLRALEAEYQPGYRSMVFHVHDAIQRQRLGDSPDEPTGDFAEVENAEGMTYYRSPAGKWRRFSDDLERPWEHIGAVRVLDAGVSK